MKRTNLFWLAVLGLILVGSAVIWWFDLLQFFSLAHLQEKAAVLTAWVQQHYLLSVLSFLVVYIFVIALSVPVTGPLTLLAGFLFGAIRGALLSIFAATVGATIAFLVIRRGVSDTVRKSYGKKLKTFEKNMQTYGAFYLLILNFSTVVPYGVINLLAALARVPVRTIIWTSAVGFVPLASVYGFAGSRLTEIGSMQDLFSPQVVLAFVLLMLLMFVPIVVKKIQEGGKS